MSTAWRAPQYWNHTTIRDEERRSLRAFMEKHRGVLKGKVLDFGAGTPETCREPQPYKDLVDGEYFPYENGDLAPILKHGVFFDAVICTQVIQYVFDPVTTLDAIRSWLRDDGHLVMTYPTAWDEVESDDLWRFTRAGMDKLLEESDFTILHHERRAEIDLGGFRFPLGYGVVARPTISTISKMKTARRADSTCTCIDPQGGKLHNEGCAVWDRMEH